MKLKRFKKRVVPKMVGVRILPDVYERLALACLPVPVTAEMKRKLARIRETGLLFIHTPKAAGTSISEALYGLQVKHTSVRVYEKVAPGLLETAESFAVVRNPLERFLSAYQYAVNGGTSDKRVSYPFRRIYSSFASIDDAIAYLKTAKSIFDIGPIFRPQAWFFCNQKLEIRVRKLVRFDRLENIEGETGINLHGRISKLNESPGRNFSLTSAQEREILEFYKIDSLIYDET